MHSTLVQCRRALLLKSTYLLCQIISGLIDSYKYISIYMYYRVRRSAQCVFLVSWLLVRISNYRIMCSLCKHSGIASYYLRLWCFCHTHIHMTLVSTLCHALIHEGSPPLLSSLVICVNCKLTMET